MNHYDKYLKYKNKYLELKNHYGGIKQGDPDWINLQVYGSSKFFISKGREGDRQHVLSKIPYRAEVFEEASEELQRDRSFLMDAIRANVKVFDKYAYLNGLHIGDIEDRDLVLRIIEEFPNYVIEASLRFRSPDFILDALRKNPRVYSYLFDKRIIRTIDDESFLINIIINNPGALENTPEKYIRNRDFILKLLMHNGSVYRYLPDKTILKTIDDKELLLKIVADEPSALENISDTLKSDDIFLFDLIRKNIALYHSLPPDLLKRTDDRALILRVLKSYPDAIQNIDDRLVNDKTFLIEAINKNSDVYRYIPEIPLKENVELAIKYIQKMNRHSERDYLSFVPRSLLSDTESIKRILRETKVFDILDFIEFSLKDSKPFISSIMDEFDRGLEYASPSLKRDKDLQRKERDSQRREQSGRKGRR